MLQPYRACNLLTIAASRCAPSAYPPKEKASCNPVHSHATRYTAMQRGAQPCNLVHDHATRYRTMQPCTLPCNFNAHHKNIIPGAVQVCTQRLTSPLEKRVRCSVTLETVNFHTQHKSNMSLLLSSFLGCPQSC